MKRKYFSSHMCTLIVNAYVGDAVIRPLFLLELEAGYGMVKRNVVVSCTAISGRRSSG